MTQVQRLQLLLHKFWPAEQFPDLAELALANCGSVQKRDVLSKAVASLDLENLRRLVCRQLGWVPKSDAQSRPVSGAFQSWCRVSVCWQGCLVLATAASPSRCVLPSAAYSGLLCQAVNQQLLCVCKWCGRAAHRHENSLQDALLTHP